MQLTILPTFIFIASYFTSIFSYNITTNTLAKLKRTVNDQIQNGAESKPVMVFLDNISSQTQNIPNTNKNFYPSSKPLALVSLQQPIQVFEQDSPAKQVAAQQVLYEFQQTPTNAVSNVHVKQLFQPMDLLENPSSLEANPGLVQNVNQHGGGPSSAQTQQSFAQAQPSFGQGQLSFGQSQGHFGQSQGHFGQPQQGNGQGQLVNGAGQNQFIATSESIVSPVSLNSFTNHAQNYAHTQVSHPLYNIQPHHIQAHHYVPGKYLYVNGKIVYQPNSIGLPNVHHPNAQQNHQNANPAHHQNNHQNNHQGNNHLNLLVNNNQHKVPVNNFNNRLNSQASGTAAGLKQKLIPPQNAPAVSYNSFRPPARAQIQQITKPLTTIAPKHIDDSKEEDDPDRAETEDDEEVEENEEDNDGEEDGDRGKKYEEDDEDEHHHFPKYHFEEDEYDHKSEDDDQDEDSSRDSSKQHITKKKPKKSSNSKYSKSDGYKYAEGYSSSFKKSNSSKHKDYPKRTRKNKPQTFYRTVKYMKKEGDNPKDAEGRYSEHSPVTHKQRIIKEKWYMTRSTD